MKSTKKKKNNKIQYGNIEIPDEAFLPKNMKFRVTMFMDLDLLKEIRKRAKRKRLPYQTYINQLLREIVLDGDDEAKIRKIVREEINKKVA